MNNLLAVTTSTSRKHVNESMLILYVHFEQVQTYVPPLIFTFYTSMIIQITVLVISNLI